MIPRMICSRVVSERLWRLVSGVVSVTRAPYMAAGGKKRPLEPLDAVVIVAVKSDEWERAEAQKRELERTKGAGKVEEVAEGGKETAQQEL